MLGRGGDQAVVVEVVIMNELGSRCPSASEVCNGGIGHPIPQNERKGIPWEIVRTPLRYDPIDEDIR